MAIQLDTILFLDFDGVLHPVPYGSQGIFCHLDRFENFLRAHPKLQVVISSSWRLSFSLPDLKGLFAEDLQERVIDKTPYFRDGSRYEEIQAWRNENNSQAKWIILDDYPYEFPASCPQLCLCETTIGFDAEAENRLVSMLIEENLRKLDRLH